MSHLYLCICVERPNVAIGSSEYSKRSMSGPTPVESEKLWKNLYLEKHEDYQPLAVIGNGTFGLATIFAAFHKPTQTYVSLRKVNLDVQNVELLDFIKNEVQVWRFLQHPNISTLYSTFVHQRDLWMITHFAAYGSCADLIQASFTDGLDELAIIFILREVLQALEYIHEMKYIHRAVKGSHILVDADGSVFLSGLGTALKMEQTDTVAFDFPSKAVEILHWMAPEILQQNIAGYNSKVDIYSIGMTAIELASGSLPYKDMTPTQVLLEKLQGPPPSLNTFREAPENAPAGTDSGFGSGVATGADGSVKPLKQVSQFFCQLVNDCLQKDPKYRPSATSLLSYPLFKQIKKRTKAEIPDLLQPVHPLTDFQNEKAEEGLLRMSEDLADMQLDDWIF